MKTIKETKEYLYQINGSKFISMCFYVESISEIKEIIKKIKSDNKKAKHICFAYKIDNDFKFDDDGEPVGTAGKKILDVINISNLNNLLIIVIRYMSGTKLGSKLLSRSYYNSAQLVTKDIDNITKLKKIDLYEILADELILNDVLNNLKYEIIISKKNIDGVWQIITTVNDSIKFKFKNISYIGKKFHR